MFIHGSRYSGEFTCEYICIQKKWKLLSHVRLCDPMDYMVHGILQARILEWEAFPFSRGSSQPRSPTLQADALPAEPQGKPKNARVGGLSLFQPIFLTQESNWGLLHCRQILYQLSYQEAPCIYSDCICVYVIRVIVLTVGRQHVFVSVWCMCQSVCENKSVWC